MTEKHPIILDELTEILIRNPEKAAEYQKYITYFLKKELTTKQPKTKNTYWKRKIIKQLLTEIQK